MLLTGSSLCKGEGQDAGGVVPADLLPLKQCALSLSLAGTVRSMQKRRRRVYLRFGAHEVLPTAMPEQRPAVYAFFPSVITKIFRRASTPSNSKSMVFALSNSRLSSESGLNGATAHDSILKGILNVLTRRCVSVVIRVELHEESLLADGGLLVKYHELS